MKMITIKAVVVSLAVTGLAVPAIGADVDPDVAAARGLVKQFAGELKGELKTAIKNGGAVAAISMCNVQAPGIANRLSTSSGWKIGRTSLKVRNPGNQPSPWERTVLEDFDRKKASGESPRAMEFHEVVVADGEKTFRYMKAIPTAKVCMNCHGGDNVQPEVAAKIEELYPSDKARGFKEGDIRGAFVLTRRLNSSVSQ